MAGGHIHDFHGHRVLAAAFDPVGKHAAILRNRNNGNRGVASFVPAGGIEQFFFTAVPLDVDTRLLVPGFPLKEKNEVPYGSHIRINGHGQEVSHPPPDGVATWSGVQPSAAIPRLLLDPSSNARTLLL